MFIGKHTIKINFISVNLIVCPTYELTFLIGMKYRGKKKPDYTRPCRTQVLDIHWEAWNVFPEAKES